MRILVTSSRNTFALDMVRKLASAGHAVIASDTYGGAIGSHSAYLEAHVVTASPTFATDQFIADVSRVVEEHRIDMVLPTFEEAFYLAARRHELPAGATLFTGSFEALAHLHHKASFQRMCAQAGVPAPETIIATDDTSLREATESLPSYFARAAFSRGGVALLTSTGPLAGRTTIDQVHPTPEQPWLVQPFVSGPMVCSYSVVVGGRITAHSTYRAPEQWQHSTGIEFLSVDSTDTLRYAQQVVAALGDYTGQLSFDYVDNDGQLLMIECNPRTTNGVLLMGAEQLSGALTHPGPGTAVVPAVVPAGQEVAIAAAVVLESFTEPLSHLPQALDHLRHARSLGAGWHDPRAMLWAPASLVHGLRLARGHHEKVLAALGADIVWDGQPIPGMSQADAAALASLRSG